MKRRTLLAAGGGALVALGAGLIVNRPDPATGLLPGAYTIDPLGPLTLNPGGEQTLTALSLCCAGVTWTLQAVYHRGRIAARLGTHLGWISLLIGVGFLLPDPDSEQEWQTLLFILGTARAYGKRRRRLAEMEREEEEWEQGPQGPGPI